MLSSWPNELLGAGAGGKRWLTMGVLWTAAFLSLTPASFLHDYHGHAAVPFCHVIPALELLVALG